MKWFDLPSGGHGLLLFIELGSLEDISGLLSECFLEQTVCGDVGTVALVLRDHAVLSFHRFELWNRQFVR